MMRTGATGESKGSSNGSDNESKSRTPKTTNGNIDYDLQRMLMIPYAKAASIPRNHRKPSVVPQQNYSMEEPVFSKNIQPKINKRRTQSVIVPNSSDQSQNAANLYTQQLQWQQNQRLQTYMRPTFEELEDDAVLDIDKDRSSQRTTPSTSLSPQQRPTSVLVVPSRELTHTHLNNSHHDYRVHDNIIVNSKVMRKRKDSVSAHIERLKSFREKKSEDEAYANARLEQGIVPKAVDSALKLKANHQNSSTKVSNLGEYTSMESPREAPARPIQRKSITFRTPDPPDSQEASRTQRKQSMAEESTLMMPTGQPRRRSSVRQSDLASFNFNTSNGKTISSSAGASEENGNGSISRKVRPVSAGPTVFIKSKQNDEVVPRARKQDGEDSTGSSEQYQYRNQKLSMLSSEIRGENSTPKRNDANAGQDLGHITKLVDRVISLEAELRQAHEKIMYLETERSSLLTEVDEWKVKGSEWSQLISKWIPIFAEIKNAGHNMMTPTMQHAAKAFINDVEFVKLS